MKRSSILVLAALGVALSGCNWIKSLGKKDNVEPPTPLTEFTPTVQVQKLWGEGSGSFRTRGQYSSATVRGTKWLVQDTCSGTLTRVTKGVVAVRDSVRRKTIVLRAGHKYLARPKRR